MNYGEIKAEVLRKLHRTDLTSFIPTFIAQAESEYNLRTDAAHDITAGGDARETWISQNAPNVYIFGALMQAGIETDDDAMTSKYAALFERAVEQAHYAETRPIGQDPLDTDVPRADSFDILTG